MLRHQYLRNHKRAILTGMQISGKLNDHLEQIDREATEMVERLTNRMAKAEGVTEALKQVNWAPMNMIREIVELFAVNKKFLDDLPLPEVNPFLAGMYTYIEDSYKEIINELNKNKAFTDELNEKLVSAIKEYKKTYEIEKKETK